MSSSILDKYKYNITSQDGEDGILNFLTNNFQINKSLVEIGSHNGEWLSNVYNLWKNNSYKGLLVEYSDQPYNELKRKYGNYKNIQIIKKKILPTGLNSIDEVVKKNNFFSKPGILSIEASCLKDCFAYDYHILKHMNYLKPQIIIIGHAFNIPPHLEFQEPEYDQIPFHLLGASVKSIQILAKKKNYKLIYCTSVNSIYVNSELSSNFPDLEASFFSYNMHVKQGETSTDELILVSNPYYLCAYHTLNNDLKKILITKMDRLRNIYKRCTGKIAIDIKKVPADYKKYIKKFNFYAI